MGVLQWTLTGVLFTLSLSILNSECKEGVRDVNINWRPHICSFFVIGEIALENLPKVITIFTTIWAISSFLKIFSIRSHPKSKWLWNLVERYSLFWILVTKKYLKTHGFLYFKILEISKWKNGVDQNEQSNVDHFTGSLFECVLFIYVPSDWINKLDAIQPRTLEPCNLHVLVYALLREVINILIWRSSFQTDSYPYQMA